MAIAEKLEAFVREADRAASISDDELRSFLGQGAFDLRYPEIDPRSEAYKEAVLNVYTSITGHRYDAKINEKTSFDFDAAIKSPFPYCTRSPTTTGDHLMGLGALVKRFPAKPGAESWTWDRVGATRRKFSPAWAMTSSRWMSTVGFAT